MEEIKKLQADSSEGSKDGIGTAELLTIIQQQRDDIKQQREDIEVLKEFIRSGPSPAEQARRESEIQKIFTEAEEGRSPDQLKQAENWVARQIGGRLMVQRGPKGVDGTGPLEIIFDRYVVTQELIDSGKTTLPLGFTVTHSVPVAALARYYIEIILDEESYVSDPEKLLAVVENSKERATHPTEFAFLFDSRGLKPLQSRAARRGKKT